ncbi:MAG: DedA family protein [Nitrospirae bacterium]|nr:DedA family protein [Nitrospirota bacterium]
MELIRDLIEIFLHIDKHLAAVIQDYGVWTYSILFLIVFCETGLVVTPFLPGDSLLFAAGALAAVGSLDVSLITVILAAASIAGDNTNYWIGYFAGPKVFRKTNSRLMKKEYLDRTHRFYEKYGGKTILVARFAPILRTFAPFVAGIGRMSYPRFLLFSVAGGIIWISVFVFGGYLFGNIPIVKDNFTLVILVIILISLAPGIIGLLSSRKVERGN